MGFTFCSSGLGYVGQSSAKRKPKPKQKPRGKPISSKIGVEKERTKREAFRTGGRVFEAREARRESRFAEREETKREKFRFYGGVVNTMVGGAAQSFSSTQQPQQQQLPPGYQAYGMQQQQYGMPGTGYGMQQPGGGYGMPGAEADFFAPEPGGDAMKQYMPIILIGALLVGGIALLRPKS